jgi:hypothetical protein
MKSNIVFIREKQQNIIIPAAVNTLMAQVFIIKITANMFYI